MDVIQATNAELLSEGMVEELQVFKAVISLQRRITIARAIDHLHLWRQIAAKKTHELHLIFEENANVDQDWSTLWNKKYLPTLPKNAFAIMLIGYYYFYQ